MNDPRDPRQAVPPGLCTSCRHAAVVPSDRHAEYLLCERSKTDDRFPRYPRLPVRVCDGYRESDRRA
jgi:hypothetical protein